MTEEQRLPFTEEIRNSIKIAGANTIGLEDLVKKAQKEEPIDWNRNNLSLIISLENSGEGRDPISDEEMAIMLSKHPETELGIRDYLKPAYGNVLKQLVETVGPYYGAVVKNTDNEVVPAMLLESPGVKVDGDEKHNQIAEAQSKQYAWKIAYETKNYDFYKGNITSSVLKRVIGSATDVELERLLEGKVGISQQKLFGNFATREGKLKPSEIRKYLLKSEANASDEQKQGLYVAAGKIYARNPESD